MLSTISPLLIYHANCLDGFGAACAAVAHFGTEGCELFEGRHGDLPPDVANRTLYLLDFSYKREVLRTLCQQSQQVVIIDHHLSAAEDLAGLESEIDNLRLHFDMEQSGATLSWRYFHPHSAVPELLLDIEDRDLWRFTRPESIDVTTALSSYPFEIARWQQWMAQPAMRQQLQQEGAVINRFRSQMVERYKRRAFEADICGYRVPVVNAPSEITSELLGELSQQRPFAASYQDMVDKRSWSLRSNGKQGVNVAEIATRFGGGGHRNAAGFSTAVTLPFPLNPT
ncbi:phosphoesterase [Ectothiorhodospiraceae bacterium BW-2]|nr:phosphoesterase [Ectothiorhodospiraceae bacterium BW-2]